MYYIGILQNIHITIKSQNFNVITCVIPTPTGSVLGQ